MEENKKIQEEHVISENAKAMELSHLIKEAIDDGRYNEAKEMINIVLNNSEVSDGTKYGIVLQQKKLGRILGESLETAESKEIEKRINASKGAQTSNKSRLIKEAMNDGRYDEAREMIQSILDDESVSEGTKNMVKLQLQKLEKMLLELPNQEGFKQLPKNEKHYEMFNKYGIFFTTEDLKDLEESPIVRDYYIQKTPRFTRSKLYNDEIKFEELKDLAEGNKDTLAGCIFIAEACKYFCLEDLGMQALKGYKKEHSNINEDEQKAISDAISLLKTKERDYSIGEKWNAIYARLDKLRNLEEPDDERE